SQSDRVAAPSLTIAPQASDPLRYGLGRGAVTLSYGILPFWEVGVSTGLLYIKADQRDWSGVINGFTYNGGFSHTQFDKVRLGTKMVLNPHQDAVKVVFFGGAAFPTQSGNDPQALTTNTIDWDFGASFNYRIVTLQLGYFIAGDRGYPSPSPSVAYPYPGFDNPNQLTAALGFNVPIIPHVLKGIAEINRVHYDGADSRPPDYSEATSRARLPLRDTAFPFPGR